MTWEQWLFEFKGLRDKEIAEQEAQRACAEMEYRGYRDLLINLLGLNIYGEKSALEKEQDKRNGRDPSIPRIVPLSYLAGQPEVLAHYMKEGKKREAEKEGLDDVDFEAFSSQLHDQLRTGRSLLPKTLLDGILTDAPKRAPWQSGSQATLQALGVKPRSRDTAAPHVSTRPKVVDDYEREQQQAAPTPDLEHTATPEYSSAELDKFRRALAGEE